MVSSLQVSWLKFCRTDSLSKIICAHSYQLICKMKNTYNQLAKVREREAVLWKNTAEIFLQPLRQYLTNNSMKVTQWSHLPTKTMSYHRHFLSFYLCRWSETSKNVNIFDYLHSMWPSPFILYMKCISKQFLIINKRNKLLTMSCNHWTLRPTF